MLTCGSDMRKYGALAKGLVDIPSHHIRPEKHGKTENRFAIPFVDLQKYILIHHSCPRSDSEDGANEFCCTVDGNDGDWF